jgi:hypothetical protein
MSFRTTYSSTCRQRSYRFVLEYLTDSSLRSSIHTATPITILMSRLVNRISGLKVLGLKRVPLHDNASSDTFSQWSASSLSE